MTADSLVIVAHYDRRAPDDLFRLLRELREREAGAPFDIAVVVNAETAEPLAPPPALADIPISTRANAGYNIGAWEHGWRAHPGYGFYLFLQDECFIRRDGWLAAHRRAAEKPNTGFVGESMVHCATWARYRSGYEATYQAIAARARALDIDIGANADHLQTLIVGAGQRALEATGGFLTADDKVGAMAGEVLTSRRARASGLVNRQVAWRPFEYIGHPQWASARERSQSWGYSASRAAHLLAPDFLNARLRRSG